MFDDSLVLNSSLYSSTDFNSTESSDLITPKEINGFPIVGASPYPIVLTGVAASTLKPTITITASDATAAETLAGQTANTGKFTLTRSDSITDALTVNYSISGTAVNGQDYDILRGIATFAAGSSTAVINLKPINDTVYEGKETVKLTLSANTKYNLGTAQSATVNLFDNDKPTINISAKDGSAAETLAGEASNRGQFVLSRTGNTANSLTVNYLISGTATNGQDYNNLTGSVTFVAGSATAVIDISTIDDAVYEGNEKISLTLATNSKYTLGQKSSASVSLIDNELLPFIAVTSPNGGEVLKTGSTYTITWNDNIGENVKIELYKGGSFYKTIKTSTVSDGKENWTVGSLILDGSDYTFKISSLSDSNLFDFSDSNFSIADWFSQNLEDAKITNLTRTLATDAELDRNDVISILRNTKDGSVIDANEIADLNTIIGNATKFNIQDYVVVLADKVVNGDLANQKYQGSNLGNLYGGSSDTHMENLIKKWFLGSDRPQSTYTYEYYSQPLFLDGISPDDVKQGILGDCYFLAILGSIANEQPDYIEDMFIDNGDNTFTVRFFNNGVADYVTVDRYLPTSWWGAANAGASYEMWVALAEKAYAQLAESGWSRGSNATNSYDSIVSGSVAWTIPQVTNMSATIQFITSVTKEQIIELSNANNLLNATFVLGTVAADQIVNGHSYVITAYDAATDKFFLHNPWGSYHASVTWEQLFANQAFIEWSV
jgi:hypothetical protein